MNAYDQAIEMQRQMSFNEICRVGLPCFAQVGMSSGGFRCSLLTETPAKGKSCAFRKELPTDKPQNSKGAKTEKEATRKSRVICRTSSGVVFG